MNIEGFTFCSNVEGALVYKFDTAAPTYELLVGTTPETVATPYLFFIPATSFKADGFTFATYARTELNRYTDVLQKELALPCNFAGVYFTLNDTTYVALCGWDTPFLNIDGVDWCIPQYPSDDCSFAYWSLMHRDDDRLLCSASWPASNGWRINEAQRWIDLSIPFVGYTPASAFIPVLPLAELCNFLITNFV